MVLVLPPDLTAAQSALWLDQQLFPGKPIYNTGHFLTIRGPLRFDLFEQALRETIEETRASSCHPGLVPTLDLPFWISATRTIPWPRQNNGYKTKSVNRFR